MTGIMAVATVCAAEPNSAGWTPPDSLDALPATSGLPPLLTTAAGRPVASGAEWNERRRELQAMMQYYVYGHLPGRPDRVEGRLESQRTLPQVGGTEERLTLHIAAPRPLSMRIAVYRPSGTQRRPVIIREEHALGHLEEVPAILKRGYMHVEFAREDLDPDEANIVGPAQQAYPEHDWATLAVWAWGAMRVVDYLETRSDVDPDRMALVGHSRGGKMALLAAAMDERIRLVAPNGSGCGGAGSFRVQQKGAETLELITRPERFGYWFHPRLRWFSGRENRLPVDQHFLKALVAPRAVLCTEARGDVWANPEGSQVTSRAAQEVFDLLGVPDHNALHLRDGQHDLTPVDWKAILDFADWVFHDRRPEHPERFFQHRRASAAPVRPPDRATD